MGDEEVFAFFADFVDDVGDSFGWIRGEDSICPDELASNLYGNESVLIRNVTGWTNGVETVGGDCPRNVVVELKWILVSEASVIRSLRQQRQAHLDTQLVLIPRREIGVHRRLQHRSSASSKTPPDEYSPQ